LTVDTILRWADRHHGRTGKWPYLKTGSVPESPGDTWAMIDAGLRAGSRGLPGGTSRGPFQQAGNLLDSG
jgi:hypothetical protein